MNTKTEIFARDNGLKDKLMDMNMDMAKKVELTK